MEQNTKIQTRNNQSLPQLVEVSVPVRVGMSNSMFVLFFVIIFVIAFAVLSYFGLVPEGVRETNATLFSFNAGDSQGAQALTGTIPTQTTASQIVDTLVVSPQEIPDATAQVRSVQQQNQGAVPQHLYSTTGKVLPNRLVIEKIGVDTSISSPASVDVAVLDQALLLGGVRYPASASLEENGNVLLFGHSTTLPVVRNQAYKAFVGIGTLVVGDEIKVRSADREYLYSVTKVSKVSADKELILFPTTGRTLTLVTCNLLGVKSDRFVVGAVFVRSYPLAS